MYKVIVAGSRDFNDYKLLEKKLIKFLHGKKPVDVQIVSGGANGADKLGEKFALEKGCDIKEFIPDWNLLGDSAGHLRNSEMSKYADACIVFWDGRSAGTKSMIELAMQQNLDLEIVRYKDYY